jgi:hypothetical protein
MTVGHLKKQQRYDEWKHIIDYETFWILMFSTVVLSSGIFAFAAISQNQPYTIP